MARPKEFEPSVALERAMEVFWRKGYEATSIQDLVEGMGISRASLYGTFGDKHSLFVSALDRYADSVGGELVRLLAAEGSPRDVLSNALRQVAAWHAGERRVPPGCFMTNAAMELCQRCPDTAARVQASVERLTDAFEAVLARGQALGEVTRAHAAADLARYLCGVVQGAVVMGKAGQGRAAIEPFVAVALASLAPQEGSTRP